MNRYRLTAYFVLTALVSITVALLVVNQVIGEIAEDQLTTSWTTGSVTRQKRRLSLKGNF